MANASGNSQKFSPLLLQKLIFLVVEVTVSTGFFRYTECTWVFIFLKFDLKFRHFVSRLFFPLNRGRYVYDCCCILCLGDDIWNWIFVHSTYLVKTRIKIWVLRGDIESRSPRNVTNNDNGFREARYSPSVTLLCVMRRICGKCVFLCLPKKTPGVQKCSA